MPKPPIAQPMNVAHNGHPAAGLLEGLEGASDAAVWTVIGGGPGVFGRLHVLKSVQDAAVGQFALDAVEVDVFGDFEGAIEVAEAGEGGPAAGAVAQVTRGDDGSEAADEQGHEGFL